MNTAPHHRRTTAFAVLTLALVLPLAACQTSVGGTDAPVAPVQVELEEPRPPSVEPVGPTPSPTAPAGSSPRAKCIADYVAQGFEADGVAAALCSGGGLRAY